LKKQISELSEGACTVPNFLSLFRLVLVPVFIVLFSKNYILWAFIVLIISGITDFVDGKIARKFHQVSNLGKLLDPVADKITQITIAVMFFLEFNRADNNVIHSFSYVFLIFLIKEAVMILGSAALLAMDIRPGAAEYPGKIATFAFYTVMILIIAFGPDFGVFRDIWTIPDKPLIVLVSISAGLTVYALFSYIPPTIREVKEKKKHTAEISSNDKSDKTE
jgi:cardiolipin synthase